MCFGRVPWWFEIEPHVGHRLAAFRAWRRDSLTFRRLQMIWPFADILPLEAFAAAEAREVILVGPIISVATHDATSTVPGLLATNRQ
jgi:hypothetical protein